MTVTVVYPTNAVDSITDVTELPGIDWHQSATQGVLHIIELSL